MTNSVATLESASVLCRVDSAASSAVVCRCLQVTEGEVIDAVETCGIQSLKELGRCTGAGQGCTACHHLLRQYLDG